MGKLFEAVSKDSLEPSITDRIWGVLQEVVIAIATLFGLNDEDIYNSANNKAFAPIKSPLPADAYAGRTLRKIFGQCNRFSPYCCTFATNL